MPSSHIILCRPFSSCPQSLPASESFPMSQIFAWGGQSTGVSALASFLPKNTQTAYLGLNVAYTLAIRPCVSPSTHSPCHTGFEYTKPTPASRPCYLLCSPPETLVCSSSLADAFISSHFLPSVTSPRQPSDQLISMLPAWVTPVLVFPGLMWSEIFLAFFYLFIICSSYFPPHFTCFKKRSSKGQILLSVCSSLAFPGPRTVCHTWQALDK